MARQLELLAWCAGRQSRDDEAVRLASAAAAIRLRIGAPAKRLEREKVERTLAQARAGISADAYNEAWREGRTTSLERILGLGRPSAGTLAAEPQAYFCGSMSRRTAEMRLAGTPSWRACSRITASSGAR